MAQHAMRAYHIWCAPPRKPKERIELANIGGSGVDLLVLAKQLAVDLEVSPLTRGARFTRFDAHDLRHRSLRFAGSSGRYGSDGDIVDVTTGQRVGSLDRNHAPLTPLRNALVVPKAGKGALLLVENYSGQGLLSRYRDQLERRFKERFNDDYLLHVEAIIDPQVWAVLMGQVQLEAVTAVVWKMADRGAKLKPLKAGVLRIERQGYRGSKLNRKLLEDALTGDVPPHVLVGLEEPLPEDTEIQVTVDDGSGSKTYTLGRERWPTVSQQLAPDDSDRPSDPDFYDAVSQAAPTLLRRLQVDLPPDWDDARP